VITLICVGKLKEKALRTLCDEYLKRLGRYSAVREIEVPDLPEPDRASDREREALLLEEGRRILKRVGPRDHVTALCVEGSWRDSLSLSAQLAGQRDRGASDAVFIIGGSLGLSAEVKARANERLSLSPMTFPHGLARLVLLEQLYRAHKIIAGERYHK
jgi:23S rRNA (pseudouridine1915-N3)-methyltransferase